MKEVGKITGIVTIALMAIFGIGIIAEDA